MTSIPTLKFDPAWATTPVAQIARDTLLTFPEVGEAIFDDVYAAAMEMASRGDDQPVLYQRLLAHGFKKGHASRITVAVNRRTSALIKRERAIGAKVKEAEWLFSGASCGDQDHAPLTGQVYNLAEGMPFGGRFIHPGDEPECKCIFLVKPSFG